VPCRGFAVFVDVDQVGRESVGGQIGVLDAAPEFFPRPARCPGVVFRTRLNVRGRYVRVLEPFASRLRLPALASISRPIKGCFRARIRIAEILRK
jgi:hypothetical protein